MLALLFAACTPAPAPSASKERAPPAPERPAPPPPLRLAALSASSGDPRPLLDGDSSTAWRPYGHHTREWVTLRFEGPVDIRGYTLHSCGEGRAEIRPFHDGKPQEMLELSRDDARRTFPPEPLRSLTFEIESWSGNACWSAIGLAGHTLQPPRQYVAKLQAEDLRRPIPLYRPHNLFDGDPLSMWSPGESPRIQLDFDASVEVREVEVWRGGTTDVSPAGWALVVDVGNGSHTLRVPPGPGPHRIAMPEPVRGRTVKLQALPPPGAPGKPAVGELRFWDGEGPYGVWLPTKPMAFGVLTRARGTHLERQIDYVLKSACAPERRQLRLRSTSTVSWRERKQPGEPFDGFDGSWAIEERGDAGTRLRIIGARKSSGERFEETLWVRRAARLDASAYSAAMERADCKLPYQEAQERDAVIVRGLVNDLLVLDQTEK